MPSLHGRRRSKKGVLSCRSYPSAAVRTVGSFSFARRRPVRLEWLAYHRSIGFTDAVVTTNDCLDRSPELLERLQELELLMHLPIKAGPDEKPQMVAYLAAEDRSAIRDADWAMVLDADEFLNIHVGDGSVGALLDAAPEATAFVLNWRVYGSAGWRTWEPGFVCERFPRTACAGDAANLSFKTLASRLDAYACPLTPHGPAYADESRLEELHYVNGAGAPLSTKYATTRTFLQSEPSEVSWALAQVNPYNTRS